MSPRALKSPILLLGGRNVVGVGRSAWPFRPGVRPVVQAFDVLPDAAEQLLKGRLSPVSLTMEQDTGGEVEKLKIDFLYVLSRIEASDTHHARVLVADRRWFWDRRVIFRRYNVRTRVGVKRLAAPDRPEMIPVAEDIWYKPWSTRDGEGRNPWRADQVLRDVMTRVLVAEKEENGQLARWSIRPNVNLRGLRDLPIEKLETSDNGAVALGRVLSYLPEVDVTVRPDGEVVFYSRVSGGESHQIARAGPEVVGEGHVELITRERIRPRKVRVLFHREIELRFDYVELKTATSSQARTKDQRYMDNVLPIPDYSLTVAGRSAPLTQGTWLKFPLALTSWGNLPHPPRPLSFEFIRKAMVPFVDMWVGTRLAGRASPDADWMARLSAVQQHYRQTFRISPRWLSRIYSMLPYRVAIIDQETGTRSPAIAYSDFSRMGTARPVAWALAQEPSDEDTLVPNVMNVDGYPTGTGTPPAITDEDHPAPARVSVVDSDQGIIRLDYLVDTVRMFDVCLPSKIDNPPTLILKAAPFRTIAFDALPTNSRDLPTLATEHKVAVILTVLPGSPNDNRQLHAVEIEADDPRLLKYMPPAFQAGLSKSNGPVLEVLIGASPETTALVAWSDEWKGRIDQVFGIKGEKDEYQDLSPITLNAGPGGVLEAVALATTATIQASMPDRQQGSKTVKFRKDIEIDGSISEFSHEVTRDGKMRTVIQLRPEGPTIDIAALMPDNVRDLILRRAQPGGQG